MIRDEPAADAAVRTLPTRAVESYPIFQGGRWDVGRWNASLEREVLRGVRRACDAPLDSATLRRDVARQMLRLVPSEAYFFNTLDPDTGLLTHLLGDGAPRELKQHFVTVLYPGGEAERVIDLARTGSVTAGQSSPSFDSAIRAVGFGHELRAAFAIGDEPWGLWCALRERSRARFEDRELGFVRRVVPWIARALRTATLAATARQLGDDAEQGAGGTLPGVIVVDAADRVVQRTMAATVQLTDIADEDVGPDQLPSSLVALLARQRCGPTDSAELRLPGRSGRWYSIRATLTEPDVAGRTNSVLIIAPMARAEVAPFLARLWGLTPREREVVALVARGHATKEIAARMGISPYTVQDHLDSASGKVGVRGRRELLAKLFFDRYAKQLSH